MHQLINMSESQPVPALNHSTLPSSSLLSHNPDPTKIDAFNQLTNGIANLFNFNQTSYKDCIEVADLISFRTVIGIRFFQHMQEENVASLCLKFHNLVPQASVQHPKVVSLLYNQPLKYEPNLRLVYTVYSYRLTLSSSDQQLEQMLQGELQGSWPYQQLFMSRQSRQPNRGEYGLAYQRELYQFQQQYIDEVRRFVNWFERLRGSSEFHDSCTSMNKIRPLDNCLRLVKWVVN
ncbi:hypothetical protein Leryth_021317 [Lithospermum erythrorhizon]|nr:hypothetical protein Leryth_021317 [Lithospermum erythrorhizon]